jgi:hypothetical protein
VEDIPKEIRWDTELVRIRAMQAGWSFLQTIANQLNAEGMLMLGS